ncbi:IS1/IS1595 family N-terminal zinc-binding domain-containing protein [Fischerella sp. PCC 9605]|uniref:IS1/IS1595 family N-terminal zinc-binding domain-containing protein n=1 Tax=Fischerella sp. PCC 9605 TaxID=1173024 RepID=UPI00047B2F91|nr:IS1 family transposase [Fischerella sp. PCC 9605]
MSKIHYSKVGNFISGAAGILSAVSVYSVFSSPDITVKNFALDLAMISGGVSISSYIVSKTSQDSIDYQVEKIVGEYQSKLNSSQKTLENLSAKNTEVSNLVKKLQEELKEKQEVVIQLQSFTQAFKAQTEKKLKELNAKLNTDDTRIKDFIAELKRAFWQLTRDRIAYDYERLGDLITNKLERQEYENIHPQLRDFYDQLKSNHRYHCELLSSINEIDTETIDIAKQLIDIFFKVSDQCAALKVRLRNLLSLDDRLALNEALEELVIRRDPKQFIPAEKARSALDQLHQGNMEDIQKLKDSFNLNKSSFEELKEQVADLLTLIDSKNLEINELKEKVRVLSLPRQFYGGSNIPNSGNAIIKYYYERYGYHLDAVHWEETETGYKLLFSIRKNPGLTIDDVYAENSRQQLAAFTNALKGKLPEFDFNYQHCIVTLSVVLRPAVKKDKSREEIDKIWVPVNRFESYVKNWERVRITAGSTGGKSPTAKNLALAIMKARQGQGSIRLYDPQHGSKKDYWDMPKAGTSHEDNVKGMKELVEELNRRTKSPDDHPFILYIFDEVDSTIAQERENQGYYHFRDLVTYTLKQASHQNLGAIFIGQACDASTIPGMSWSDWNNAIQLHIGANAGTWLDKAKTIPSDQKTKLLEQYAKIQEYCDRQNEELGLDIFTDATAYRFALAVPLTGLPKFIQLPDFDTYDYSDVMSTNTQKAFFSKNSEWVEIQQQNSVVEPKIQCPHCGSDDIYKNGKTTKGVQYYSCNDCDNTPKKWTVEQSTNSN